MSRTSRLVVIVAAWLVPVTWISVALRCSVHLPQHDGPPAGGPGTRCRSPGRPGTSRASERAGGAGRGV